jgi:hypothetical protein
MRIRSHVLAWSLLLTALLSLNVGVALADQHEESSDEVEIEEYKGGTVDPADEQEAESEQERMRAMSDVRFGTDTHFFSRVPIGLGRMGDLLFFRPLNIALGGIAAATYVIAVGPTLAFEPNAHDKLADDLLIEPWRLLWKRPLGGPLDYRARDKVAAAEGEAEIPIE